MFDLRAHFCERYDQGSSDRDKIFVKSAENDSDIMEQRISKGKQLHVCKVKNWCNTVQEMNDEKRTFKMKKTGRMLES